MAERLIVIAGLLNRMNRYISYPPDFIEQRSLSMQNPPSEPWREGGHSHDWQPQRENFPAEPWRDAREISQPFVSPYHPISGSVSDLSGVHLAVPPPGRTAAAQNRRLFVLSSIGGGVLVLALAVILGLGFIMHNQRNVTSTCPPVANVASGKPYF